MFDCETVCPVASVQALRSVFRMSQTSVDNYVTYNSPTVDKFLEKYDKYFTHQATFKRKIDKSSQSHYKHVVLFQI